MGGVGLGPRDVHVWTAWLESDERASNDAWSVLASSERQFAERLRRPADRHRYVGTRAHLRRLLAAYARCRPEQLRFSTTHHGKPQLANPVGPGPIRFNVSHSGVIAAIAVSHREVGVDVERVDAELSWREIAAEFFSPIELGSFEQVAPEERTRAFFDCWVRKEAYLKAEGIGLRRPTTDFTVPVLEAAGDVVDLGRDPAPIGSETAWSVRSVDVGRGYSAAVCVQRDATVTARWIPRT